MAKFGWTDWQSEEDEDVTDARPGVYWITILDPEGEEIAVIVHRTSDGQFPLDGPLAKEKEAQAQMIVDALNAAQEVKCPVCGELGYSDPDECSFCQNQR